MIACGPNLYAPGRAHIVVYNWGRAGIVPVDVAAVLLSGDAYVVRSVQALFDAPLVSGVYTGGSINLPMSLRSPPVPVGLASSPDTLTNSDAASDHWGRWHAPLPESANVSPVMGTNRQA